MSAPVIYQLIDRVSVMASSEDSANYVMHLNSGTELISLRAYHVLDDKLNAHLTEITRLRNIAYTLKEENARLKREGLYDQTDARDITIAAQKDLIGQLAARLESKDLGTAEKQINSLNITISGMDTQLASYRNTIRSLEEQLRQVRVAASVKPL